MNYYGIAGLNIAMHFAGETMTKQAKAYELKEKPENVDIEINPTAADIIALHEAQPQATMNLCEYMWTGTKFYEKLLDFDGFLLHSSAIVVDDEAYLFSAPSGTGKSTHTGLWLERFGERARILNDDKPAIRKIEDGVFACGTPWSGKYDLSSNELVPLRGICFLERAEENSIEEISSKEAIPLILEQTTKIRSMEILEKLCTCIENVLSCVKVYRLKCNISDEAVETSYNAMKKKD